jgi:hypothetical protein
MSLQKRQIMEAAGIEPAKHSRRPRRRLTPLQELGALVSLSSRRLSAGSSPETRAELLHVLDIIEGRIAVDRTMAAFTELIEDTSQLYDPEQKGYHGAAVAVEASTLKTTPAGLPVQMGGL